MLFSFLKLSMYSTKPYFPCCVVFIVISRDYFNSRYGYIVRICSWIDRAFSSIRFKVLLIILSYSGCSLILFYIWMGQNSLNIIAYAFLRSIQMFFSFHIIINLCITHWFEGIILRFHLGSSSIDITLTSIYFIKSNISLLRIYYLI